MSQVWSSEFKAGSFNEAGAWQTLFTRPFAEQFIESSPHILEGALTGFSVNVSRFHVEKENGVRHYY
ncbi:MAG: hypothetical protein LBU83_05885, partial [Bacteroidales bacterium]|nr:hypothetical protein [Bacteroidales bacterium]